MRLGSLCTGYGGLELALTLAGVRVELEWAADNGKAASALLAHRHPGVPNLGDIKALDLRALTEIDILTAGYPCQPFPLAGQRKGTDDERHLWPYVFQAVRHLRPSYVLLENVAGHRSRGLAEVIADLASIGYVGSWVSLRASDVGAAHQRDRVFVYAHPADTPGHGHRHPRAALLGGIPAAAVAGGAGAVELLPTPHASCSTGAGRQGRDGGMNLQTAVATLPTPAARDHKGRSLPNRRGGLALPDAIAALLPTPRATDGTNGGPNQRGSKGDLALPAAVQPERWGRYAPAIARWEQALGRPAPEPTEPGKTGPRLAPVLVEWLMGLETGYVTGVPGLSRNDQLRLLGNGVVPQQGTEAIRRLLALTELSRLGSAR